MGRPAGIVATEGWLEREVMSAIEERRARSWGMALSYLVTASGCSPAGAVAAVLLGMPVTT